MASFSKEELLKYVHSPVHHAVASRDYMALRRIVSSLPKLAKAEEIGTESSAIAEEVKAEKVSLVLDRRDVPGRETALHLAVKMGDAVAAEILMASGIDWSLQNEQGWSALQEAVCSREDAIAMVIMRYYQPMAWAKWCRRVPRVISAMNTMRDFYMELTFHFESSVIPFIGRIAPSDTYRIWKRGSNLRADMTLAGFDGLRIQRSDQSFLFLGEGSPDGKIPPGSLCMLNHKEKEIMNALARAGTQPTDAEIAQEVAAMSQTNMYRPGIDVTQAEVLPQLTWRRQEKSEMVGQWKAKLYDMHHVMVSVKSRRVPGAMSDEELFGTSENDIKEDEGVEDFAELLTEEEKKQLETALKMEYVDGEEDGYGDGDDDGNSKSYLGISNSCRGIDGFKDEKSRLSLSRLDLNVDRKEDKKGWFSWGKRSLKQDGSKRIEPPRTSFSSDAKVSDFLENNSRGDHVTKVAKKQDGARRSSDRHLSGFRLEHGSPMHKRDKDTRKFACSKEHARKRKVTPSTDVGDENVYRKGLRPVLWLTHTFPLDIEELLPLLDILANKVKAVRRLRELLTTKLPAGTFPVKVAIPIVPTIRVLVTFSKFEELIPKDEFTTPPSSPDQLITIDDSVNHVNGDLNHSSSSWLSWIKNSANKVSKMSTTNSECNNSEAVIDPFLIPADYAWTSVDLKKHKSKEKHLKRGFRPTQNGSEHND